MHLGSRRRTIIGMDTSTPRKPYPTDVTDDEWGFVAPSLTLMTPDAPQRRHEVREVFNALRWIVRAGAALADQLPAVGSGVSTDPAVDRGGLFRGDGA